MHCVSCVRLRVERIHPAPIVRSESWSATFTGPMAVGVSPGAGYSCPVDLYAVVNGRTVFRIESLSFDPLHMSVALGLVHLFRSNGSPPVLCRVPITNLHLPTRRSVNVALDDLQILYYLLCALLLRFLMDFEPRPPATVNGGTIAIASFTAGFPPMCRLYSKPVRTRDVCTVQLVISIEDRELDSPPSGQDIERKLRRRCDLRVLPSLFALHFLVRLGRK